MRAEPQLPVRLCGNFGGRRDEHPLGRRIQTLDRLDRPRDELATDRTDPHDQGVRLVVFGRQDGFDVAERA
jgi:hypothetical protein